MYSTYMQGGMKAAITSRVIIMVHLCNTGIRCSAMKFVAHHYYVVNISVPFQQIKPYYIDT